MTVNQLAGMLEAMRLQGHGDAQVFIGDEDEMTTKSIKPIVKYEDYPLSPHYTGVYIESEYTVR